MVSEFEIKKDIINLAINHTDQALMAELSIYYNGRYYKYDVYRYDHLADAVNYAQLMRSRHIVPSCVDSFTNEEMVTTPSIENYKLMETLSISFAAGVYEFSGFHYENLADAVNYAMHVKKLSKIVS